MQTVDFTRLLPEQPRSTADGLSQRPRRLEDPEGFNSLRGLWTFGDFVAIRDESGDYFNSTRVPRIFWLLSVLRKLGMIWSISSKYDDRAGVFCWGL